LAEATAHRYRAAFKEATSEIGADSAPDQMRAYGTLFVETLCDQGDLCLAGVLAADVSSLPEQVRAEVEFFFAEQYDWVAAVLRQGQANGEIRKDLDPDQFARMFVAGLEGSMMVSRSIRQPQDLETSLDMLIQVATS